MDGETGGGPVLPISLLVMERLNNRVCDIRSFDLILASKGSN